MKVVLKQDIDKLGSTGDIVKVADGYGRNYLLPHGLALKATPGAEKVAEHIKKAKGRKIREEKAGFEEIAKKLSSLSLTIPVQVGEDEKMYGSVTSIDIANMLKQEGIEIDKKNISLKDPIKKLGIFNIQIKLHPEVTAEVKTWVVKA
ncbi:MAG: 50S ribosomal protein L9 [bacterium]|nr:50S ribosomal protein L9 [bacterium]